MTAVRDFVRTYERRRERRAPSANDSNNGCNEFKQFRIAEWRRVAASVSAIFTEDKTFLRSRSRRYRLYVLLTIDVQKCSIALYSNRIQ